MGCCGEPVDKEPTNRGQIQPNGMVTTQPMGQPILEKPGNSPPVSYQPTIASPPPAFVNGANSSTLTGFNNQVAPPWGQSPSPPAQHPYEFGATAPSPPIPSPSPGAFTNSSYHPQGAADPLLRPQNAYYPSLNGQAGTLSSGLPSPPPIDLSDVPVPDEGKMSVAVDFGTTFSGVAYGSSRIAGGRVQQILNWPGSVETFRKIPTCLLYDEHGQVIAWGLEAKNASPMAGTMKCEWFKLFLEPKALRDESAVDPRLPFLPPGKRALDLIVDFLSCLWEHAKEQITRDIGAVADLNSADVLLTVPAAWDAKGCDMMREAAIAAGLVQSSRAGDRNWRDRLRIITEPEAAAVHCAHLSDLHHLKPSQNFIVCDAGGGTVDLAAYKIIGQMANLEIAEMCARSGANCGSLFLDLRFRELVRTLLTDHPAHLDPASLAYFMHSFSETDKHNYAGIQDDDLMFHFPCFNTEDPQDPSVGLINGELCIPGNLLRREVFDPVVNEVLQLIEEQMSRIEQRIDALLLVGGFAGSEYLRQRVEPRTLIQEQYGSRIRVIARPPDADTATLRGAAQYGLARRPLVASVIAPRAYIMKAWVKLPAEQEDWLKRPAYIRTNDAAAGSVNNRLQYLVSKGAILRKGQRLSTKFWFRLPFSKFGLDTTFVATLFTSDANTIMRYTDEGETTELCKWTVDLSSLPSFRNNAATQAGGFYTEFELGLELDSAEVRGILLYNNQEWGRRQTILGRAEAGPKAVRSQAEGSSILVLLQDTLSDVASVTCIRYPAITEIRRISPAPAVPAVPNPGRRGDRAALDILPNPLVGRIIKPIHKKCLFQNTPTMSSSQFETKLADIPLHTLYDLLRPITLSAKRTRFNNWGLAFYCIPLAIFEPESLYQCKLVLELARREGKTVRAVGVGHSPSDLACTSGYMVRLTKMNRLIQVDYEKRCALVEAGITLQDLHAELDKYNLAMINVGSISDQTLGGIVTTATHGSGVNYGVMSTNVRALKLLLADGRTVVCSRTEEPELFNATLCGLGATGILLEVLLEVEPAFRLKETQEPISFDDMVRDMDHLVDSAQHVRFWWFPAVDQVICSSADRTYESPKPAGSSWFWNTFFGFHLVQMLLFFGRYFLFLNVWTQYLSFWLSSAKSVGINDSHRIFNVDCKYPQFTTEWSIPYANAQACLQELRSWIQQELSDANGLRPHFPVEVRFSAADDIWLSPSNGQLTCWIGLIQYKPYGLNVPYQSLFGNFEAIVARHQGRPHWAKAHKLRPDDLRRLYPRFDDFLQVLERVDPNGVFRNEYVQRHIYGKPIDSRVFKLRS
ncbi:hypothetical protein NP233_g2855 [Leucocoprinus birnbaumii]|uniref:D-arabinono-1,4-lactone oxidase n=1 Tax=Leucocoprinus birnbaumii TaxID=56174 RepID=A0AAD5VY55_9AGAR|nr:hypothetical protein NP233_g2855 [Leucocoprinus birnbaumii]